MSSFLYGRLTRNRLLTKPPQNLSYVLDQAAVAPAPAGGGGGAVAAPGAPAVEAPAVTPVKHWQDALAALVPAEVLVIHATAMSLGTTTTTRADGTTVSTITSPGQMRIVFVAMILLAAGLYLAGVKRASLLNVVRSGLAAVSFVLWTMIQPNTAFDAWNSHLSTFLRVMIAIIGAIVVAGAVNLLAGKADAEHPAG